MNVILIILDTLRQDHVGCYGNDWIHTPSLDALARKSVRFTRAYPEILPTLPARRALHTGMRLFPPREHIPYKGDFTGAPGWGPVLESQDTIPELLQAAGYRTALITDTYHQFKPSKNFHRGFDQWTWIRGQETDPYRSGPIPEPRLINRHVPATVRSEGRIGFLKQYLTNVAGRQSEEDYFAPQVFRAAMTWLTQNQDAEKFFLVVDSFDPHEPWDPPAYYRKMYEPDVEANVVDMIFSPYGPADQITDAELKRLRANYAGEVTMVDRWLGHFIQTVENLGLVENTLLIVVSDHGHCLGEHGLISKQGHPMTREVADLCLLIRPPGGERAGTVCDSFVYHHDLPATILAYAGVEPTRPLDGVDLRPLISGERGHRDQVTVGWGPFMMVRDNRYWYNDFLWGQAPLLYDLDVDPHLNTNVAPDHSELCEKMRQLGLQEVGEHIPPYLRTMAAAREPGCTPLGP